MTTQEPHILKPSKSRPFPTVLYFLDTETVLEDIGHKTKLHSLRMGICQKHVRNGPASLKLDKEFIITNKTKFADWLVSQQKLKSHSYIIAHNVVYDASILDLFRELPKRGYKLQSLYSKGQVCIVRFSNDTSKLTMIDNGNIFSGTLEKWGAIFDIPKIKIDFETCSYDELVIYCRRDVEIMVKAWSVWMQFLSEHDCGGFRETVGSTAFNTWRHKYMQREVYVHKDETVLKMERESYHGGRVEAFHQGVLWTDEYFYLDINNMYGYIMKNYKVPVGLQGYSEKLPLKRMISYLSRYCVIADVTVNVDEQAFVTKKDNRVCYPLGRFRTTLTTHEIEYALSNGWIENLHAFSWYKADYLFSGFISDYYALRMSYRLQQNKGFEAICKLMINSLYGKFGQTGIMQRVIGHVPYNEVWHMPIIDAQSGERFYQTAIGGTVIEERHKGESYHAMPAIAAHITANARLYLFSLLKKAGLENVYYCDTDSMIVNRMGFYNVETLINESELGKLKVETKSPWIIVNAPKDYEMSERRKVKGIRNNATQIDDNTFLQEQWVKLAGLIRDGFQSGYTSKEITKHQNRIIYSGVVTQTGKIEPFHFE